VNDTDFICFITELNISK